MENHSIPALVVNASCLQEVGTGIVELFWGFVTKAVRDKKARFQSLVHPSQTRGHLCKIENLADRGAVKHTHSASVIVQFRGSVPSFFDWVTNEVFLYTLFFIILIIGPEGLTVVTVWDGCGIFLTLLAFLIRLPSFHGTFQIDLKNGGCVTSFTVTRGIIDAWLSFLLLLPLNSPAIRMENGLRPRRPNSRFSILLALHTIHRYQKGYFIYRNVLKAWCR